MILLVFYSLFHQVSKTCSAPRRTDALALWVWADICIRRYRTDSF